MISERYKRILARGAGGGLESAGFESTGATGPDLSEGGIYDRVSSTEAELRRIVKDYLGDRPELYEVAGRIVSSGSDALRAVRDSDDDRLANDSTMLAGLEAIVRTDGSRPSFMIRDGHVDLKTSPIGQWEDTLQSSADKLEEAFTCVGRIDIPGPLQFEGTGFLIAENLIMTNRHVLQGIGQPDSDGVWSFPAGTLIDFGHEFRAREHVNPRALRSVVFAGEKVINLKGPVDHTKLDLVLIELEPPAPEARPRNTLKIDVAPDWAAPQALVFTIGYPANPGPFSEPPSLIEQLFQSTYGFKRCAPGEIIPAQAAGVFTWTLAHDTTTLGGNSGSVLLAAGREDVAAGLHYGGRRVDPRENWGHVLGRVLDQTDKVSGKTVHECFQRFNVQLVDRTRADGGGH